MSKVFVDLGMTLDGYIAGPNGSPGNPLGDGGVQIHSWVFIQKAWRESHNLAGGETARANGIIEETINLAGAYIMGRRMFDEGEVGWGDPPPFRAPVYVLTNDVREPWVRQGGTTFCFINDGIESALEQAIESANGKDVQISGGASVVRQYLNTGLVDELQLHLVPMFLGQGVRLFDDIDTAKVKFNLDRVVDTPQVTHLRYQAL